MGKRLLSPAQDDAVDQLLRPSRLWSAAELWASSAPIPRSPGIYAWYFDEIPPGVPAGDCHGTSDGLILLYVGISPREPKGAKPAGTRTIRHRLRDHLKGNAEGSTLRLTLGCLLAERLGIRLRRVGSGSRYTFTNPGEIVLDKWIGAHAHLAFAAIEKPWEVEDHLLSTLSLPLNLGGNRTHAYAAELSGMRLLAKRGADAMPVVVDSGGKRREAAA
ncbi:MAG: GIY-YIG nuclease family protein [Janthinobacterium lividum]